MDYKRSKDVDFWTFGCVLVWNRNGFRSHLNLLFTVGDNKMITIWLLGLALISLCFGITFLSGIFAGAAVFSWLCAFTYHAFIDE